MNQQSANRILDIQEKVCADPVLMGEYRSAQERFLELLSQLEDGQRDVLLDYLGVGIEIHLRMLALCLE